MNCSNDSTIGIIFLIIIVLLHLYVILHHKNVGYVMGVIEIENMEFYSYHGCYREEQIAGNRFLVDLVIETDLEKASKSDKIEDTLNYQQAYNIVKEQMSKKSHLLEHVAGRILDALYVSFGEITHARVKVSKMNPQMGGQMERVSVVLSR